MRHKTVKIAVISVLLMGLAAPASAQTSASSLLELINQLKQQIATLQLQISALQGAQSAVQTTRQEISGTLKLIRHLRQGMTGDDVTLLQTALAGDSEIYPEGLITGYFGQLTANAVRRFQAKHGFEQVGNVGPKTLAKLNKFLEDNPLAEVGDDDEDGDENEVKGHCAIVPPGHLIAPGWLRKQSGIRPLVPECQTLPRGIAKKISGVTPTSTVDTVAPILSGVSATNMTSSSAQIVWMTNEAANSKVYYGTISPVNLASASTAFVGSFVMNHTVVIGGLSSTTTYYYIVESTDPSGNRTTSTQYSFVTGPVADTTAPAISSIAATSTASTSVAVSWTTDEPATSRVYFSTSTPVSTTTAQTVYSNALVVSHSIGVAGLSASTTYHYLAESMDAAGNTGLSSEGSVTTLP